MPQDFAWTLVAVFALLALALGITALLLFLRVNKLEAGKAETEANLTRVEAEIAALKTRFAPVVEVEAERRRIQAETAAERVRTLAAVEAERIRLSGELTQLQYAIDQAGRSLQDLHNRGKSDLDIINTEITRKRAELAQLDEATHLLEIGFYRPRYDFAASTLYQSRLESIRDQQKQLIKEKRAAVCHSEWTVNGSKVEGRKQINQTLKLMLRAFNGECDAAVAKVKYNNVNVMEARIRKSRDAVNASAQIQMCEITTHYLDLKLQELYLAHEYQEKLQAEKEEQRRIREQIREEEIAQREIERTRQEAEKEETRYQEALARARK